MIYVEAQPIFYKDSANREQRDQTCLKSSVKSKRLGRTAQNILDSIISDGSISQDKMAERIGVSKRAIEMQIANLKANGLLVREGADRGGYWRIVINPQTEQ